MNICRRHSAARHDYAQMVGHSASPASFKSANRWFAALSELLLVSVTNQGPAVGVLL